MPTLNFPVQPDGLLVDVLIGMNAVGCLGLQQSGQPIPRPVLIRGIMDTGTDVTAVAPRVFQTLGLTRFGMAQTTTAAGPVQVDVYPISLSILPLTGSSPMFTTSHLLASELLHAAPGIEVLVGLDVILQGVFNVDGPNRVFTFSF